MQPAVGKLYQCKTTNGTVRVCRYGFHKKRDNANWGNHGLAGSKSILWVGWRDHENGRFIRKNEIVSYVEIVQKI